MQPQKTLLTSDPKSPYTQDLLDRWETFEVSILTNDTTGTFTKAQMDRLFMVFLFGINSYLCVMGRMRSDLENEKEPLEEVLARANNFHLDVLKLIKEQQ
jgi:hypothetical protein